MTAQEVKNKLDERQDAFRNYIIARGGDPDTMESFKALERTRNQTMELIDEFSGDEIMLQKIFNMVKDMDKILPHWKSYIG